MTIHFKNTVQRKTGGKKNSKWIIGLMANEKTKMANLLFNVEIYVLTEK